MKREKLGSERRRDYRLKLSKCPFVGVGGYDVQCCLCSEDDECFGLDCERWYCSTERLMFMVVLDWRGEMRWVGLAG